MPLVTVEGLEIPVPQKYKDFVVRRQHQWFWYIVLGVTGSLNVLYYLLCVAFRWKWHFTPQGDIILPLLGLYAYIKETRKPWQYIVTGKHIKLFTVMGGSGLARMEELVWSKTEVTGISHETWQGLPCLCLNVLSNTRHRFVLVYEPSEEAIIQTKAIPLIEKYRHQYRQELLADRLRS